MSWQQGILVHQEFSLQPIALRTSWPKVDERPGSPDFWEAFKAGAENLGGE
jgi:hypothetical protein